MLERDWQREIGLAIETVSKELLHPRPYLLCTCGRFEPGKQDPVRQRIKCRNCGGWRNYQEVRDNG